MTNKDIRCSYCNWLNKESKYPFVCVNCAKENTSSNKEEVLDAVDESDKWTAELIDMKGIGEETAKDIIAIYPTKEALVKELKSGAHIPLVNKHVSILKSNLIE